MRKINWLHHAVCMIAVCVSLTSLASAVDTYWQGTTGNWSVGGNWSNGEPVSSDNAYINNGGTAQITSENDEYCDFLYLGWDDTGDSGMIDLTGGSLSVGNGIYVGRYGYGVLNITNGGAVNSRGVSTSAPI